MGVKVRVSENGNIDLFLKDLVSNVEEVETKFLKRSSEVMKKRVEENLQSLRTEENDPEYKHMAEDVQASIARDKYGDPYARVRGGSKTGTKWHLVNDGTYKSQPTHFIDKAVEQSEAEIEQILDDEMKKAGFL